MISLNDKPDAIEVPRSVNQKSGIRKFLKIGNEMSPIEWREIVEKAFEALQKKIDSSKTHWGPFVAWVKDNIYYYEEGNQEIKKIGLIEVNLNSAWIKNLRIFYRITIYQVISETPKVKYSEKLKRQLKRQKKNPRRVIPN